MLVLFVEALVPVKYLATCVSLESVGDTTFHYLLGLATHYHES